MLLICFVLKLFLPFFLFPPLPSPPLSFPFLGWIWNQAWSTSIDFYFPGLCF